MMTIENLRARKLLAALRWTIDQSDPFPYQFAMECWASHSKSCIRISLFAALPTRLTPGAPFTYQFTVASDGKFDLTLPFSMRCCVVAIGSKSRGRQHQNSRISAHFSRLVN
jgi:hypothetical protein